jgi:L-ribulose-5-phosphate 4-epimerase
MLDELRREVCRLNKLLPAEGLVRMTSGNVSGRDPESGRMVIKPSGVPFAELTPESMVVMNLEGEVVEGNLKPSSDAYTHLVVYRQRPEVCGMVHTHSNYATAWAAIGEPIPCALTAMADEFGCDIPLGDFCLIGHEAIGEEIVRAIGSSTAIIMRNHGVFTIGRSARQAVKAAVMLEDAAKTLAVARSMGEIQPIGADNVAKLHDRYQNAYGQ